MLLLRTGAVAAEPASETRLLAIGVNQQRVAAVALVLLRDGDLFLTPDLFARLRLHLPDVPAVGFEGSRYYPLSALTDSRFTIDEAKQQVTLTVPPRYILATTLRREQKSGPTVAASGVGGFLNYDVLGERNEPEHAGAEYSVGAVLEVGLYAGSLVATSNQVLRDLDDDARELVRLESTITHDRPEERLSLRFGDTISRGGEWGRPVRFGGIQIGTNFATQPDFVTFPIVSLAGDAALPSSVDVLINDSRRFSGDVPAGPFVIEELPVVTGAGEVRAVVRDLLGRETVISQPYYSSPDLLRDGLQDFSLEAGFLRRDFGQDSNDYDAEPFFTGTYRTGLGDALTGELHGEFAGGRQAAGLAWAAPLWAWGVVSGAAAGAVGRDEQGGLFQLGFERLARDVSLSAFGRLTTGDYRDFGVDDSRRSANGDGRLRLGLPLGDLGTFSTSYTYRYFRDETDSQLLSATYSVGLWDVAALSLTGLATFGADDDLQGTVNLTIPLGRRVTVAGRLQVGKGKPLKTLQAKATAPLEGGFGGAATLSQNDFKRAEGEVSYSSRYGVAALSGSYVDGDTGLRLNGVGGLVVAEGEAFLSRRIEDSFAVVSVPDQAGVRVYAENRLVGETNDSGNILVHNLRAYDANNIRIDPRDLPIDSRIDTIKQVAAPRFRSGTSVKFGLDRQPLMYLTILRPDGSPIPPGASVTLAGDNRSFPVGFDGLAALRGVKSGDRLRAHFDGSSCEIVIDRPMPPGPIPNLGQYICQDGGL